MKKEKSIYYATVNGKRLKKFEKAESSFMNTTWKKFNDYANSKGYNQRHEGSEYFGGMAWSNGTDTMELIKE